MSKVEMIIDSKIKSIPVPKDGKDGIGMAGAMIDRDGNLMITTTSGETKNLGLVVGSNGKDGDDGVSFESFDIEYLEDTHEVRIKATAAGKSKEIRYDAGGIRVGKTGYWRDGVSAKACEVYSCDGNAYVAKKNTKSKPTPTSEDWVLIARKGRDAEKHVKTGKGQFGAS